MACTHVNGILFNHESPRRGETFVTRKITRAPWPTSSQGLDDCLYMGNIDALRDWGHAKDYVRMQSLMLQQDKPEDFVIATWRTTLSAAVHQLDCRSTWNVASLGRAMGADEVAIWNDKPIVPEIDPRYFTPNGG